MSQNNPPKMRKCYVLKEQEIEMENLKKGDVFRLAKATEGDCVDDKQYHIATDDAVPAKDEMPAGVQAENVTVSIILNDASLRLIDRGVTV